MSLYGTFNQDKQTQTDNYYSFEKLSESIDTNNSSNIDTNIKKSKSFFNHLDFANQSYLEHFTDSIKYCGRSIKASFFFFIHAFWPDIFTQSGSNCIHNLSETIQYKYNKRVEELHHHIEI